MARIKVTGYLEVEDLDPERVDLDHEMGLSPAGYEQTLADMLHAGMVDAEFELVTDE